MDDSVKSKKDLLREIAELRKRIAEYDNSDSDESSRFHEKQKHIKNVLLAIRNVNQLIVRENNPARLIKQACVNLTETLGYHNVWMALLDKNRNVTEIATSGFDGASKKLVEQLRQGIFPSCIKKVLEHGGIIIHNPNVDCTECPVALEYPDRVGMASRLEFEGRIYGFLVVSVPASFARDEEERNLFIELANDMGFALYKIAAEEQLRLQGMILNEIRDQVTLTNLQGKIIYVNPAEARMSGKPESDLIGQSVEVFGEDPALGPTQKDIIEKTLSDGEWHGEVINIAKDGNKLILDSRTWVMHDEDGTPKYLCGVSRDITRRKQAEQELAKSRAELKAIYENAPVLMCVLDSERCVVYANRAFTDFTGVSEEELKGGRACGVFGCVNALKDLRGCGFAPDCTDCTLLKAMEDTLQNGVNHNNVEYSATLVLQGVERNVTLLGSTSRIQFDGESNILLCLNNISDRKYMEESLRHQSQMLDMAPASITVHNREGRFLYFNQKTLDYHGYTKSEFESLNLHQVDVPESEALINERIDTLLKEGTASFEVAHLKKDGTTFPLKVDAKIVEWYGEPVILSVATDISERKNAEEALRQSEDRVRAKLDSILSPEGDIGSLELADIIDVPSIQALMHDFYDVTKIGIAIVDMKGKVLVSTGWQDVCTVFHRVHPETNRHCIESDTELSEGVEPGVFKLYRCKNNMWDIVTPIFIGGKHLGNLFLGQFFFDDETLDYNFFREQGRKYGFDEGAYIDALDRVPRWSRDFVNKVMSFYLKLANFISTLSYGNIKLARTLSERDNLLNSLRQREELLQATQRLTKIGGWEWDIEKQSMFWTEEVYRIHDLDSSDFDSGAQEHIKKSIECYDPEDRMLIMSHFKQCAEGGKGYDLEFPFTTAKGRRIWIRTTAEPVYENEKVVRVIGNIMDITERKHAEQERLRIDRQIMQTQKLESLGVLAGGIAHDFNNILMAILGHADLALDEISPMSPAKDSIIQITTAARRAAELCRQMLAYTGKASFALERTDLRELIEEMAHLLKTSISKKAILNLNLEHGLPPIKSDPSQIRQIVMNLIINASEAIGDRSGVITISAGATRCDEAYLQTTELHDDLKPGLYVHLEISDTGCGMDSETKARIFEPFFTTKFTGRGLGLAAVIGIVRAQKGALKVYSESGKGTTFKILFPALEDVDSLEKKDEVSTLIDWRGKGTVLLADDEETLRALGAKMLEMLGFTVITATDGRMAVDIYKERKNDIDLVLLDLTMPHMDGAQTYTELRRIDPDIRIILASGYSEEDVSARFAGKGLAGVLQKPYTIGKLKELLSGIMPSHDAEG